MQSLDHGLGRSTRVDPSQCMDKNSYYHSFKTWFWSKIEFFIFYYVLSIIINIIRRQSFYLVYHYQIYFCLFFFFFFYLVSFVFIVFVFLSQNNNKIRWWRYLFVIRKAPWEGHLLSFFMQRLNNARNLLEGICFFFSLKELSLSWLDYSWSPKYSYDRSFFFFFFFFHARNNH
jgi:hypothetical protein